jgi:hypothetical protein
MFLFQLTLQHLDVDGLVVDNQYLRGEHRQ